MNDDVWYATAEAAVDAVLSDPNSNTYYYAFNGFADSAPGLKALNMEDMSPAAGGIALQKNSEFRDLFNLLMIRLVEVGIIKRINMKWPDTSRDEDFGIPEPISLEFKNVLFPFTLLLLGIVTASVSACVERLFQHVLKKWETKKQVNPAGTTSQQA